MSALRLRKPSGEIAICDHEDWLVSKTSRRRWRLALTVISITRVLSSLTKKVIDKEGPLLRTLSFVALDMQPIDEDSPPDVTLLTVDPKELGDMVRDKNSVSLSQFGGAKKVALILETDVKKAVSDFKQSKQFEKLSTKSSDIRVEVVRDGRRKPISIFDVVVGDIVFLKIGDQIPADGLFLEGHSLTVDESSMTGESKHIQVDEGKPFLLSGTKVTDGFGFMLVTSVGMNTAWGEMMSSINRDLNEETPLQARLNKLTSYIGKVGLVVAALVLVVMLIRYFTGNTRDDNGNKEFNGSKTKFDDVMNAVVRIVSAAVTIIVVAIPEGLPLAVTLTLAYSMKCMMADNAMVRKLSSCETMGSATIICTDKTGTLTLNEMKVTEFWLGKEAVKDNTSSDLAVFNLSMNIEEVKQNYHIIHVEAFNSVKKRSGVLVRRNNEKTVHTHWKGAAEIILSMCSTYCDSAGVLKVMDEEERLQLGTIIKNMAQKSLRCIAFAHKEVTEEGGQVVEKLEENGLTLLGLVGLKDPCRPGVSKAVESCRAAGVNIKMITGDNVHTARAIAFECKILNPHEDLDNEAVIEGKGHVVAVTGDGTNDAPALKEADIGLSMGIQGTEVAKESSDIVILDDNFASIVTVLKWGRCVYTNIQKFLQFQLTVNVAALCINFVAAVSSGKVPLTAVQLLWVNLIMDTLGALALATEKPTDDLMEKSPVGRSKPLITTIMWRNLMAQAVYQRFANTERLDWGQWGACIGLAALSWPIGWVVKCIPVSGKWLAKQRASCANLFQVLINKIYISFL
uniref:Uncharacterized protein n=1 Tax=Fagus sylvatica TaxID=28930 RepID=A0A2N9G615_FAGSY